VRQTSLLSTSPFPFRSLPPSLSSTPSESGRRLLIRSDCMPKSFSLLRNLPREEEERVCPRSCCTHHQTKETGAFCAAKVIQLPQTDLPFSRLPFSSSLLDVTIYQPSSSCSPRTLPLSEGPRSSTTPCFPRLPSTGSSLLLTSPLFLSFQSRSQTLLATLGLHRSGRSE